ncbi:helix-turn-helix domain-containing protein [Pseudoalteromonas sp. SSM20]|uniref:helix-turn-helix domain-containing protein n=1 Tax=Pseudoalteromonas sp. SSM20 TaxID=3139394 RepID=UPI003BAC55C0
MTLIVLSWRGAQVNKNNTSGPLASFLLCIMGYILLTTPIENAHYGGLRQVLLLLTDVTCFSLLWLTVSLLNPKFRLARMNKVKLTIVSTYLFWLIYFFLVLDGHGIMHHANHALGLAIFIYVIYLCLNEYFDDLDNQRRNNRLLLLAICVAYMCAITLFEFGLRDVRNSWQFSLLNSMISFVFVSSYFIKKLQDFKPVIPQPERTTDKASQALIQLNALMKNGAYLQANLTIGELASQLAIPAHQLRQVINQELGFSNFSHYLNSYRVPYICEQLKDPSKQHIPVLTLALEAGYGSIAPFNRAFKSQMGITPTQYRGQF